MNSFKDWAFIALCSLLILFSFVFEDAIKALPRWIGPAMAIAYCIYSLSKHIDRLERRIAYLEENRINRRD